MNVLVALTMPVNNAVIPGGRYWVKDGHTEYSQIEPGTKQYKKQKRSFKEQPGSSFLIGTAKEMKKGGIKYRPHQKKALKTKNRASNLRNVEISTFSGPKAQRMREKVQKPVKKRDIAAAAAKFAETEGPGSRANFYKQDS